MRLSRKVLMATLDYAIDEVARLQKENKEIKERAYDACELVESLAQQISNLESEVESLQFAEAMTETRDYNRSRRIGMKLQEGNNG